MSLPAPALFNIIVTLPADLDDASVGSLASVLEDAALATSSVRAGNDHRGEWVVTWLVEAVPDDLAERLAGRVWRVEEVPSVNWLEHSYQQFQPFHVEDFYIYGSHHEDAPPVGFIPLQIDAATAFGSGEHGTTAGCLRALIALCHADVMPRRILDMGTGSGILAVAAVRLWPGVPVLAVDIDEESVIVAARHALMNGVADAIECAAGDGFAAALVQAQKPFDLVIANILAGPLVAMASDLSAVLNPGGHAILSGMLAEQTDEVMAAYAALGFTLRERYEQNDWVAVLLKKVDA